MFIRSGFDYPAKGIHAGFVPGKARQVAPGGPAPIAIHNNGKVAQSRLLFGLRLHGLLPF